VIHLDTSVLVDVFSGDRPAARRLRRVIEQGERLTFATLVLYEWRRGPRRREELEAQEALFPAALAVPFGPEEAALAARLFQSVPGARRRVADLAIAACALRHGAALWTAHREGFRDIPDLALVDPGR
jgi:predicted nucleic acid-binding protein